MMTMFYSLRVFVLGAVIIGAFGSQENKCSGKDIQISLISSKES
jgi:hypothetical protein